MSEDRFFIAGATGLTGRSLVEVCTEAGLATLAHIRPDSSSLERWRSRWSELGAQCDESPWELQALTQTLTRYRPTHVFALLGTTRKRASRAKRRGADPNDESYKRVDYGLTHILRQACEACGASPRFVYLSAAGVTPKTGNPYMAARARIEAELRGGSLPYTIVRPSFILGDRDEARAGETVGASLSDAGLWALGLVGGARVRDRYRSIQAPALARELMRLALDPEAIGATLSAEDLRG